MGNEHSGRRRYGWQTLSTHLEEAKHSGALSKLVNGIVLGTQIRVDDLNWVDVALWDPKLLYLVDN